MHPLTRELYRELANRNLFSDLYQHDRMLADHVRVEAYRRAIEKHVKPGHVVHDLGTGSGLLALMAAKAGAAKVYAIDHGPWIDAARAVAKDNGLTNVEFHRVNSRRFTCPEKLDVIVQEQIGDALFEEGMIDNISDLRDRLLAPGGRILPDRFELFVDPVQLREPRPFVWEQVIAGIRFAALRDLGEKQPVTYRFKPLPPQDFDHFLTRSEPVLGFDLQSVKMRIDCPGHCLRACGQRGRTLRWLLPSFSGAVRRRDHSRHRTVWPPHLLAQSPPAHGDARGGGRRDDRLASSGARLG